MVDQHFCIPCPFSNKHEDINKKKWVDARRDTCTLGFLAPKSIEAVRNVERSNGPGYVCRYNPSIKGARNE